MGALLLAWMCHITQAWEALHPNLTCMVILLPTRLSPYTNTRIFENVSVHTRVSCSQLLGSMICHLFMVIKCLRGSKFRQLLLHHSTISDLHIHPPPLLKAYPTLNRPTSRAWRIILTQSLHTLLIKHPLLSATRIIHRSFKTVFSQTSDRFTNLASLPAESSLLRYTLCVIIHIEEIQWTIKHCAFCALGHLDARRLTRLNAPMWPLGNVCNTFILYPILLCRCRLFLGFLCHISS